MSKTIPDSLRLSDYDYDLPRERIAQFPLPRRDESKLLVIDRAGGGIRHQTFRDLGSFLTPHDLLVVNKTRVIMARLPGVKVGTGARLEVFLLRDLGRGRWETLIKPQRRVKNGSEIELGHGIKARVEAWVREGVFQLKIATHEHEPVGVLLERQGQVPLPPYIRREPVPEDRERYQTVFAREQGAVAAPTAGLHFTDDHLEDLTGKGIGLASVVLHTGLGTFRPIKEDDVSKHRMDVEYFRIGEDVVRKVVECRARGGRIVAVGTTTTRALESAARWNGAQDLVPAEGWTEQYIFPPFEFRVVDVLLTNFHVPKSTLLVMVSAFAGRDLIMRAYREALAEGYRFLSYGDCMLIV